MICYLAHILLQGKIALSELGLAATLAAVAWALKRDEIRPSFHILYYPLLMYGVVSTTSAIVNHSSRHLFGESALWLKMLVFPAALILFREVPRSRELALRAQIVFAVVMAGYGIVQYLMTEQHDLEHRITGPSTHVMTYSGLTLPLSLLLVVIAVRRRQVWLFACAFIVSFALLLTFTRSVWLGWLVAVFTVLVLNRSKWIVFAIPVLLLGITFMPESMFGRLVSSFDVRQSSNLDRIRMAEAGIEMIKDHPVLGVGPAQVKEIYPLYRKPDAPRFRPPHLHNNLIQLWAERGIGAVIAYLLLLGLFFRECARGWRGPGREFAEAGVAIAVGLAYAGLFEFNFGDTEVFLVMLELFALVTASIEAAQLAMNEPGAVAVPGDGAPAFAGPSPAQAGAP
ncbi:MAG TPA: O-antigen ligase family protein [Thermoanaerobaculia bacterium]|nr:O-antigen ligase family protein [Thermoanaerobaculia bacterium]